MRVMCLIGALFVVAGCGGSTNSVAPTNTRDTQAVPDGISHGSS